MIVKDPRLHGRSVLTAQIEENVRLHLRCPATRTTILLRNLPFVNKSS
jgi:hypothetical protein